MARTKQSIPTVEPKNNQKATKRAAVASGIFLLLSLSKIKMQQKAWELELKRSLIWIENGTVTE